MSTVTTSLADRLPGTPDPDALYDAFEAWARNDGIDPYPAQVEALIELLSGGNVILTTPTGSGKSLVATGAHFAALAGGRRTFYTAPIKALVSERFFALCEVFGADRVGMLTGDAAVNAEAPVICATAEVLANIALREGADTDVGQVVMDEFHFYADPDRGWAWQVPLIELTGCQFLLMSATLGDVSFFAEDLRRRTGRDTTVVSSLTRPVPLHHSYVTTPVHESIAELLEARQAPIYVVHFTQAAAAERAQALTSVNVCTRAEKDAIAAAIGDFRFTAGFGRTLSRLVRHGIGIHHAGMLPRYRRLVERLTQAGLLKVICGTDTLGVGINVPIRTVLLTGLAKYDGRRTRLLNAREFHQITGRAGRPGFDTIGYAVTQAPEHVVDNVKAEAKALAKSGEEKNKKKRAKVVKKKPPEGAVNWSQQTHERLVAAQPEPLRSRMRVSHSLLLNVIARPGDGFEHMRRLLRDNHSDRAGQNRLIRRAVATFRELRSAGVVATLDRPDATGRSVVLTVDLQADFALNQALSAFALAAFDLLDPASATFALDVVSVVEATLEEPRQVLRAQRNAARGEAVAAMKADGLDYEERMEHVEEVTWPRPLAELLETAFEAYRHSHPWIAEHPVAPKSVVRDMVEQALTFTDFVRLYGLARSEGLVLRYLSDAYKALRQTVPAALKSEALVDVIEWLGETIRQTDSSLLDEWEQLTGQAGPAGTAAAEPAEPPPVTANRRAFRVLVRNALFRRARLASLRRWGELGELDAEAGWDAAAWAQALEPYFADHAEIGTGADARGPDMLLIEEHPDRWLVRQILDDPEADHDWGISAEVDLRASDAAGDAAVRLSAVNRL